MLYLILPSPLSSARESPTQLSLAPTNNQQKQEFNPLKSGKRKNRQMDDPYVSDSHLSPQDDHSLVDSHASEVLTTKVEEHSPNEEEHNKRQHKPENEDRHLLKKKKAQRNGRSTVSGFHSSKATFIECNFMFCVLLF